ncbi:hypothetical protein EBR03_04460 [bacterium]|nr:hypothetical protein [bacterium]
MLTLKWLHIKKPFNFNYLDGRGGETRTRSPLFKNIHKINLNDDSNLETRSFSLSVFQLLSQFICNFSTPHPRLCFDQVDKS